ncbi:MAG: hypothetical protein AAB627_01605 [Patescibacteria group bacterium]
MKIINIASSDNFEDILEAVRTSESAGLILIVPKSNRVFKSGARVNKLKDYFDKLGKDVSIISSSDEIIKNANLAGFNILQETKMADKKDEEIVSLYSEEPPQEKEIKSIPHPVRVRARISNKKIIFIFLAVALLSLGFIAFISVSQAKIKITPGKKDFSVNIPVMVSSSITRPDEVYGMIPGELIQVEKVVSKTFTASGDKEVFQKAEGEIIIYNNFSAVPQVLVATTRFQTPEGLVFRILKTVTVPGKVKVGNELKPGEIKAKVIADRAGEEYNIEPTEFKIPGFLGGPKYQAFYAKSFSSFSGGFVGRSSFVTKDDLKKAEEQVRQEAISDVKNELALLKDFKILEEALEIETEKMPDSAKDGDLVKEFKVSLKARAKALAFKESDVMDFISQYISNSQGLMIIRNGLSINYNEPKLDKAKMELSFKLVSRGKTAENVDKERIITEILGKKAPEVKKYLGNLKEIESAQVLLSPFWIKAVPKNRDKIRVEIIIE